MSIDEHQKNLLVDLVQAERRVPREQREHFIIANTVGPAGVQVIHSGWTDTDRRVFEGDLETLARAGLIAMSSLGRGLEGFYVTPQGHKFFETFMLQRGEPTKRLQSMTVEYLKAPEFQRRHMSAFSKWAQAEALLWANDTGASLTTIGHLAREAMQEFAGSLSALHPGISVDTDKSKTVSRIRAILNESPAVQTSDTGKAFLIALLAYWGTVNDLVQSLEHGSQREGRSIMWADARRVVFQTANVMFEIDQALATR